MFAFNSSLLPYGGVALAILISLQIVKVAQAALSGPLSTIPGPALNKWTPLPLGWALLRRRQVHYIHSLHEKYGPIVLVSPKFVSFTSPETMKAIHKIGSEFKKGPFYENLQLDGTLVCLTNIKEHLARRKHFSKAFSQSHLLEWEDVIKKHVVDSVVGMKGDGRGGTAFNILKLVSHMASSVIGELVLGGDDSPQQAKIIQRIHTEFPVPSSELAQSIPWYLRVLPQSILRWSRRQVTSQEYEPLAQKDVQVMIREPKRHTLLSKAIREAGVDCQLPEEILVKEQKAFIVAGTDTTAITATYLIWQILKHPEVKARLQDELRCLKDDFSIGDVQALKYLHCVINETLRLNGSVSSTLQRITPKGGREIGGYFIPEETRVTTQSFTLHRNPDIFQDPWSFTPERWQTATAEMKGAFMPFGIGSRGCIGIQLAQMELALVAAVFFREYPDARIAPSTRDEDMIAEDMFVLSPRKHKCMIVL